MCDTFDWKRPDDAFPAYPSLNCGGIIHVLYSDPRFHVGNARWPSQVIRCPYGTRLNLVPNIPASRTGGLLSAVPNRTCAMIPVLGIVNGILRILLDSGWVI